MVAVQGAVANGLSAVICLVFCVSFSLAGGTNYLIGAGIADVTGPAADVDMMGYANPSQTSKGIHLRLYSRAFIVADNQNKTRVVFVSVDAAMVSQIMKIKVVEKLKAKYGGLYTEENVCLSGIHTHSGPGGFLQYVLFSVTSLGFVSQSLDALVDGVVKSIDRAHANVRPGNILLNEGELLETNINRSPTAYLNNPQAERNRYKYNVDKNMTILKFVDAQNKGIGMISWYAVHCTSMNNTNQLISGDNKGYASYLFEKSMNKGSLPGKGPFVAAFAQSNEGDVSPNTRGPHCINSGRPCDIISSTCDGKVISRVALLLTNRDGHFKNKNNELCIASGPGKDMTDSTRIIGENQFKKAMSLFQSAQTVISGPVDFRHQFVDMSNVTVQINKTHTAKTCKPAMGYSFAAGTTDGPGMFDFKQGTTKDNLFWNIIRDFIATPTAEQVSCQHPKPILLDTGEATHPYLWAPRIVDTQILRLGSLAVVAVPGEFTTMSGRRLRDAVLKSLLSGGFPANTKAVIAGLSNTYADYIATYEEYQVQRYEGASTIYGPHTLQAYIQHFTGLAQAMAKHQPVSPGPSPPDLSSSQLSFLPPVIFDHAPLGKNYGSVVSDVMPKYVPGEMAIVTFISANPRNNLLTEKSFLTVERQLKDQSWQVVYTDSDWNTKFEWIRTSTVLGESNARITWEIPANQMLGTYRIRHFGYYKHLIGGTVPFSGSSAKFQVGKSKRLKYDNRTQSHHQGRHQGRHHRHHHQRHRQMVHRMSNRTPRD